MENYIDTAVSTIRERVGDGNVLLALSGGVDSSVAAVLLDKAVGSRLTCIFVDHGLLRRGEAQQVVETFSDAYNMKLIAVDAADLSRKTQRRWTRKQSARSSARIYSRLRKKPPNSAN